VDFVIVLLFYLKTQSFGLSNQRNTWQKRKYSKSYLKFGLFTFTVNNGLDIPVYVLCHKTLGNNAMKPSLFTRHLERTYPEF